VAFELLNMKRVEGILKQALEREANPAQTGSITSLPARFKLDADYFSHHATKEEHDHGSNC
jgi:hypothetical protein